MSTSLRISLLIFSIVLLLVITVVLRKGRIPIKYSLLWYFSGFILLIVAIMPFSLECLAQLLGFTTISNLVVGVMITVLLFLTMALTIITSGQKKKINLLIQEISILKKDK